MSEKANESPADTADSTPVDPVVRAQRVDSLSKNHILSSMGVGLVPIPVVDIVGALAVQLNLIKKLSIEYGVPFEQDRSKAILTSLLGGLFPVAAGGVVISLLKFVPIIGQTAGAVTMPVMLGAATYAVGKVFVQHYEAGGTILDFDAGKMKKTFTEQFCAGKDVASNLRGEAQQQKAAS